MAASETAVGSGMRLIEPNATPPKSGPVYSKLASNGRERKSDLDVPKGNPMLHRVPGCHVPTEVKFNSDKSVVEVPNSRN
jgi:hypothetical protein